MKQLTQKQLKKMLNYNPNTGVFKWIVKHGNKNIGDVAGYLNKINGYRYIGVCGKIYNASRLAYLYMEGYFPEHEVDHRDRNKGNDKWNNLRHVNRVCNVRNQGMRKDNKSGVTGVFWSKDRNKWCARITVFKKVKNLGYFVNLIDAVKARWEAEKKYDWPNCDTASSAFNYLKEVFNGPIS